MKHLKLFEQYSEEKNKDLAVLNDIASSLFNNQPEINNFIDSIDDYGFIGNSTFKEYHIQFKKEYNKDLLLSVDFEKILSRYLNKEIFVKPYPMSGTFTIYYYDKVLINPNKYVYHFTSKNNIDNIKEEGIHGKYKRTKLAISNVVYCINSKNLKTAINDLNELTGVEINDQVIIKIDSKHYTWYIDPNYNDNSSILTTDIIKPEHLTFI